MASAGSVQVERQQILMGWSLDPLPCPTPTCVQGTWLKAAGTRHPGKIQSAIRQVI